MTAPPPLEPREARVPDRPPEGETLSGEGRERSEDDGMNDPRCQVCDKTIEAHYARSRFLKRGYGYCSLSCSATAQNKRADEDVWIRFLRRVDMSNGDESCWPYTGRKNAGGYGQIDWQRRPHLTHRMMYEILNGPVPDDMAVCHSCDNPICCNPGHLWLGTLADNNRDMWEKGRGRIRPVRSEDCRFAKITENDAREVRASREHWSVLAARFGLSYYQIRNIRLGRAWKNA